jgi:DNA-binding YbaB/EbfC family protein
MKMGDLMKQAQQFQEKMGTIQEELASKVVTGSAGGGMVTATVNGSSELVGLAIEKDVVKPEDIQMLQDLIMAAVNDGLNKAKELGKEEMGKLTGGFNIPGMF